MLKSNESNEVNHFLQPSSVLNAANFHQQMINYANNFNNNNNNNNTSSSSLVEDSSYENDTSNDNQSESNDTDHNSSQYLQSTNETINHKQSVQNSAAKKRSFNVDSLLAPDQNSANEENEESDDSDENNNRRKRQRTSGDESEDDDTTTTTMPTAKQNKSSESLNDSFDDLDQKTKETYSSKKLAELNQKQKLKNQRILNDSMKGSNLQQQQHQQQLRHSRSSLHLSTDQHQNSPFSKLESNNVDVEKWKQTFSKIMARSYKNNNNQFSSSNLVDSFSPNKNK